MTFEPTLGNMTPEQYLECGEARGRSQPTRRPISPEMEDLIYQPFPVLDHGFIRVIDYMGNDEAICQMARVSYGKGTKTPSGDEGLIRYLMRHYHTSPFEGCEVKFHVKLPVFVARQWIRHRTANVNEYSARYSILEKEFFVPDENDLMHQSTDNKQGRGGAIERAERQRILDLILRSADQDFAVYDSLIEDHDLARELSRAVLPMSTYTQWYWKIDLHNLFNFLMLRADSHAQKEIRVYAEVMLQMVRSWVPLAARAFEDYRLGAATFSRQELEALRKMIDHLGNDVIWEQLDALNILASKREVSEFAAKLQLEGARN